MKLYYYDHCPYCVKARMIFGLKDVPVTLVPVLNDDVETPTKLVGRKVVPILEKEDGTPMPESMDIVRYIDGTYKGGPLLDGPQNPAIAAWLENRPYASKLTMPRWVQCDLPEFKTDSARRWFKEKKEEAIGSFDEHLKRSEEYIKQSEEDLQKLDSLIQSKGAVNGAPSEDDVHLFAALRSQTIVKGLRFPHKVAEYLENMSALTNVPLYFQIAI